MVLTAAATWSGFTGKRNFALPLVISGQSRDAVLVLVQSRHQYNSSDQTVPLTTRHLGCDAPPNHEPDDRWCSTAQAYQTFERMSVRVYQQRLAVKPARLKGRADRDRRQRREPAPNGIRRWDKTRRRRQDRVKREAASTGGTVTSQLPPSSSIDELHFCRPAAGWWDSRRWSKCRKCRKCRSSARNSFVARPSLLSLSLQVLPLSWRFS